ncbi:MAG: T9SS type A sorting domain-containing protein [Flavobacteriales bacterium]|nr:T9SS type A sorting domain-containing protein [Flavobacteriales bacterium]MCB9168395.1 T9SS type A sorting domain-containing protein [Flavobacteriales bacterium]
MKRPTRLLLVAAIAVWSGAAAQPGALDPAFATNGIYHPLIDSVAAEAKAVAIQADGKIVTAGYWDHGGASPYADFYLQRFNTDGTPDMSFGTDGQVIETVANGVDAAWSVVVQPDGKILAGGFGNQSWERMVVMRFLSDGTLDSGFGSGGKSIVQVGGFSDRIWDMKLQSDGKILTCGTCFISGSQSDWCATRLNANGSLDTGFGAGGKVVLDLGTQQVSAESMALQADGRIVLGGYGQTGGVYHMQFARLNTDGTLDPTFNGDGLAEVSVNGIDDAIKSVAVQSDGKIVGGGYARMANDYDFALVRLNTDGTLDPTFDGDGKVTTPIGAADDILFSIYLRPDGKIVAGGQSMQPGTGMDFALAMYDPDGSLQTGFGNNGIVTTTMAPNEDILFELVPDANGNIVAAGGAETNVFDVVVARYLDQADVGLGARPDAEGVSVFPNPASTRITITGSHGNTRIRAIDALGRIAGSWSTTDPSTEIPIVALGQGTYLLEVTDNEGRSHHRITISR